VLAISFSTIGMLVFIFSCSLLGGTLYFFMDSIKSLREIKKEQEQHNNNLHFRVTPEPGVALTEPGPPFKKFPSYFQLTNSPKVSPPPTPLESKSINDIQTLKATFQQQNKLLNRLLLEMESKEAEDPGIGALNAKVEQLELVLEDKEEEIQKLNKQGDLTKKMMMRFEDVQKEFVLMQTKMGTLEKQAAGANNLKIELEETKEELNQLKKEWAKKNEKLQHVFTENQGMHQQLCDTEDKLQEANLQRQQLFKKVKVIEEMNADFQSISDAHQKMQTELRRIGELESMLNMMTQERDNLLQKTKAGTGEVTL